MQHSGTGQLKRISKEEQMMCNNPSICEILNINDIKQGSSWVEDLCEIFAIPENIYICICFAQGDTGIQGIQGVSGAQVLHAYFIPTAPHYSFYMFL